MSKKSHLPLKAVTKLKEGAEDSDLSFKINPTFPRRYFLCGQFGIIFPRISLGLCTLRKNARIGG
jgi:hypothetical protein